HPVLQAQGLRLQQGGEGLFLPPPPAVQVAQGLPLPNGEQIGLQAGAPIHPPPVEQQLHKGVLRRVLRVLHRGQKPQQKEDEVLPVQLHQLVEACLIPGKVPPVVLGSLVHGAPSFHSSLSIIRETGEKHSQK